MKKKICMLAVFALPLTVGAQSIQYPVTEKGTTVDTYFGTEVKTLIAGWRTTAVRRLRHG